MTDILTVETYLVRPKYAFASLDPSKMALKPKKYYFNIQEENLFCEIVKMHNFYPSHLQGCIVFKGIDTLYYGYDNYFDLEMFWGMLTGYFIDDAVLFDQFGVLIPLTGIPISFYRNDPYLHIDFYNLCGKFNRKEAIRAIYDAALDYYSRLLETPFLIENGVATKNRSVMAILNKLRNFDFYSRVV